MTKISSRKVAGHSLSRSSKSRNLKSVDSAEHTTENVALKKRPLPKQYGRIHPRRGPLGRPSPFGKEESEKNDTRGRIPFDKGNEPTLSKNEWLKIRDSERESFEAMLPSLLKDPKYKGKHVVVIKGEIVDSDLDQKALAMRVYSKFGYHTPLYVGRVSKEKEYYVFE